MEPEDSRNRDKETVSRLKVAIYSGIQAARSIREGGSGEQGSR